jgi:Predicted membrane protein
MNEGIVVLVRSIIGFFTLLIIARILGKQQISQLTFFDYVLGITIGSIAATLSVDLGSRAWPHWVGLMTWGIIVWALQLITLKYRSAGKYIVGEPTVVIMNGQIMEDAMRSIRYTLSDVLEQLRDKGVFDLKQVGFAVVETNGKVSVLLKPEFLPATPRDLNLTSQVAGLSTELVYDGVIVEENLKRANVDQIWLMRELKKQGINQISEVFLASLDSSGGLYVDPYKEKPL